MTITYALMEKYEEICKAHSDRARLLTRSRVGTSSFSVHSLSPFISTSFFSFSENFEGG